MRTPFLTMNALSIFVLIHCAQVSVYGATTGTKAPKEGGSEPRNRKSYSEYVGKSGGSTSDDAATSNKKKAARREALVREIGRQQLIIDRYLRQNSAAKPGEKRVSDKQYAAAMLARDMAQKERDDLAR